jgi:hypothetical protein
VVACNAAKECKLHVRPSPLAGLNTIHHTFSVAQVSTIPIQYFRLAIFQFSISAKTFYRPCASPINVANECARSCKRAFKQVRAYDLMQVFQALQAYSAASA